MTASSPTPLTERQSRFVDAFIASGGDGPAAAVEAGYSPRSAARTARKNLENPSVLVEIQYRSAGRPDIATLEDRQRLWTQMMYEGGPDGDARIQLRASELLGKSQADFATRREAPAEPAEPVTFILPEVRRRRKGGGDAD